MSTKTIQLKSLKEPTEESDGLRILIARFRPRYLPKEKENWDEWCKELAPSKSLWKDYLKDKKIDWPEYSRRYKMEIKDNPQGVEALYKLSSKNINGIVENNKHSGNLPTRATELMPPKSFHGKIQGCNATLSLQR